MFLSNVNLESTNTYLKDFVAGGNVKSLSGREVSGINVKSVSTNFLVSDTDLQLENMNAAINSNSLRGDIVMSYPSLDKIATQPENVRLDLNIIDVKVALGDLFLFQPSLRANTYLQTVSKNRIAGAITASGTLADLTVPNLALSWSNTDLKANGNLKNINDIESLYFNLPNINASTNKNDISKFIATDSLSINLPQDIKLVAAAKGTLADITTTARLTTTQGLATIDGAFKNDNTIAFNTTLAIKEYNLGELLQNNSLGNLNLTLKGLGSALH